MKLPDMMYKTTIVIWSEFDASDLELEDIARDAVHGESYCSFQETEGLPKDEYSKDPYWDNTEFFGIDEK